MNTKLTLSLNQSTIRKAKKYASENGKSISKIVEDYLEEITFDQTSGKKLQKISEETAALKGIIKIHDWEQNASKDPRLDYLLEKYR